MKLDKEKEVKEVSIKSKQIKELEGEIFKIQEEKNSLVSKIAELNSTISEAQERIKLQKQKCNESDNKVARLRVELQKEKDQYKFLHYTHTADINLHRRTKWELDRTKSANNLVTHRALIQVANVKNLQDELEEGEKKIAALNEKITAVYSVVAQHEVRCKQLSEELEHAEKEKLGLFRKLADKESEVDILKRECKSMVSERDRLRSQVKNKDDVIKIKDEEIRLKQKDRSKDESLQDRANEVKILKIEMENLHKKEAILKDQASKMELLRRELSSVHGQLLDEKLRRRAMEEEFQKPQHIHR